MQKIWGIGKTTLQKLYAGGIIETKALAALTLEDVQKILGKANGEFIFNVLHAKTDYIFNEEVQTHSISSEQTFETDLVNTKAIEDILFQLSMEVSARLLTEKVTSSTAFIKIRYYDFKTYTMQEAGSPITNAQELFFVQKIYFTANMKAVNQFVYWESV